MTFMLLSWEMLHEFLLGKEVKKKILGYVTFSLVLQYLLFIINDENVSVYC